MSKPGQPGRHTFGSRYMDTAGYYHRLQQRHAHNQSYNHTDWQQQPPNWEPVTPPQDTSGWVVSAVRWYLRNLW